MIPRNLPGEQALAPAKSRHSLLWPAPWGGSSTVSGLFPRPHATSFRGATTFWTWTGRNMDWGCGENDVGGITWVNCLASWDWTCRFHRGFEDDFPSFRTCFLCFEILIGQIFVWCKPLYQGCDMFWCMSDVHRVVFSCCFSVLTCGLPLNIAMELTTGKSSNSLGHGSHSYVTGK